ncbi:hypothetical protein L226DRAFT_560366 [Lentinus tigrinus ALCF2SS1-7]|uniref:uncharacterized protein n=1 Tax=Lentinus tigrinus ALCF2SS1-7 TaxID=1328758 RepID=UPI0011662AB4|nr:hypothetical protein L226DRAFT_560366 [Lentinus tigrinus ALCF2SS1-7]
MLVKQTDYYKTLLQTVTDDGVRDQLIQYAWDRASFNKTSGEFPDVYNAVTGDRASSGGGSAGPALGAMFAHLALGIPNTTIVVPTSTESSQGSAETSSSSNDETRHSQSHVGAIVGGIVGGVALVAAGAATLVWRRRRVPIPSFSAFDSHKEMQYTIQSSYEGAPQRNPTDAPRVIESSKARERTGLMQQGEPISPPDASVTNPAALEERESTAAGSLSAAFLVGLRAEVENLRQVMQGIRDERLEPPPEYTG